MNQTPCLFLKIALFGFFLNNTIVLPKTSDLSSSVTKVEKNYDFGKFKLSIDYHHSIFIEALIRYYKFVNDSEGLSRSIKYAEQFEKKRSNLNLYPRRVFSYLPYWIYKAKPNLELKKKILAENWSYQKRIRFSPEGAMIRNYQRNSKDAVLIDAFQNYSYRTAILGELSNDKKYFKKAVEQYEVHKKILSDSQTGLWHQGRGFLKDKNSLSPSNWSRGHGWAIRGIINVLQILPPESKDFHKLKGILEELSQALINVQLSSGMWPCLLDRNPAESPEETSGTALIAGNMAIAISQGWLPEIPYTKAVRKAFAILPEFVEDDGTVLSVSPGPGPVWEVEPWLVDSFPPGDKHGSFAIIFAALGECYLDQFHKRKSLVETSVR